MFRSLNNKTYRVGGAIRNSLLGLPAADYDYVIVATVEEFESVFPDAEKVGAHFPVYLHPETGDEIALSRSEYSTGDSYQSFEVKEVGVPIFEDLGRRDFSINSIAEHYVTGDLVDPYDGRSDLEKGVIRTINENFVKEDPLRIYRAARFVVEFGFKIDEYTAELIKKDAHYIKNVNVERVFQELKKVYDRAEKPSEFFRVLKELGVLKYHFKPLFVADTVPAGPSKWHGSNTVFDHLLDSFDKAKSKGHSFPVAIASLVHDFGKIITRKSELPKHIAHEFRGVKLIEAFFKQHRFDAHTVELSKLASRHHMTFHELTEIRKPVKLVRFFKAIKKHFEEVTQVASNDHGVSAEEHTILSRLEETFKTTTIDIPKEVFARGKDSVVTFVEGKYAERFKELTRDSKN